MHHFKAHNKNNFRGGAVLLIISHSSWGWGHHFPKPNPCAPTAPHQPVSLPFQNPAFAPELIFHAR